MSHEQLISHLRQRQHPPLKTLDEYYAEAGAEVLNRMCDVARRSPEMVDNAALEWAAGHLDSSAGAYFALLIHMMAKDEERRPALRALFRTHLPGQEGPALRAAGYNLHEHCRMLDAEWLDLADRCFDMNTEGAWGIVESAAMYRADLLTPEFVDRFEARRATRPRDYFVTMLSLAGRWPERRADLLARVLRAFPEHSAPAVDAAAFAAADDADLITPELVEALLLHFGAAPEKAWEYFERAVKVNPALFDDLLLDRLNEKAKTDPGKLISIT